MSDGYETWVNADRTVMVTRWDTGEMEVAFRESPSHTWGPPVQVKAEGAQELADVLAGPGEKR